MPWLSLHLMAAAVGASMVPPGWSSTIIMGLVAGCLCLIPLTSPNGLLLLPLSTLPRLLLPLLLLTLLPLPLLPLRRRHRPARVVGHCR